MKDPRFPHFPGTPIEPHSRDVNAVKWSLEPPETPLGNRPGPYKRLLYRDPLFKLLDPSFAHVVEIGGSHGAWGWRLMQWCPHVVLYVAIDPYVTHHSEGGHRQHWHAENKQRWLSNLAPWNGAEIRGLASFDAVEDAGVRRAQLIVGRSEDVVDRIRFSIDLLFVDGDHRMQPALRDLELYVPKVRSGGIVVLDDMDLRIKPPQPGVAEALKEFASRGAFGADSWKPGPWTNAHACALWRVP